MQAFTLRRIFIGGLILVVLGLQISCSEGDPAVGVHKSSGAAQMDVFKSASCGCCKKWIEHIEKSGFEVNARNRVNMNTIKREFDIAPQNQSCHTAIYEGYVFEGHVPAEVILRFIEEPPDDAIGLAVPGMPAGSPGMEMGERFDEYDVLVLKSDGSSEIYAHIEAP
jgi:hypothetical protein